MKGSDYIIGVAESVGILCLGFIPSVSAIPVLIIISVSLAIKEKSWEIPPNFFTSNSVRYKQILKIAIGAFIRILTVTLTVYLASVSPIL